MKDYEQLESILMNKDYSELNPNEQHFVDKWMNQQTYQAQRQVLLQAKATFSAVPQPPAHLANALRTAVRVQKPQLYPWRYIALGAAAVGLVFLLGRWTAPAIVITKKPEVITKIEAKTDTVYLERIIEKMIPQARYYETIKYDTIYISAIAATEQTGTLLPSEETAASFPLPDTGAKSKNAKETSKLLKMLVEVY